MKIVDAQGRLFGTVNLIDLAMVSVLLSLAPLVYYARGSITGRFALSIESIHPTTVTAGADQLLTIMGNGFDAHSTIQLADAPPQQASFINDARLDLIKIPSQTGPGWHSVSVRNGRGRFVRRPDAIFVVWQPEIDAVSPRKIPAGMKTHLTITGRYFDAGCTVSLEPLPVQLIQTTPTRVEVVVVPPPDLLGTMNMQVTNSNGRRAVLARAVDVMPFRVKVTKMPTEPAKTVLPPAEPAKTISPPAEPAKTVLPPSELPPERTPWTGRIPSQFLVVCAFFDLEHEQARQVKRGATEYDPNGGAHRATIVEVLSPHPWVIQTHQASRNGRSRHAVVARLLLSGTRSPRGDPPVYFYRGEPLIAAGIPIPFRLGGQDLTGLTLVGYPTVMIPYPRSKQ